MSKRGRGRPKVDAWPWPETDPLADLPMEVAAEQMRGRPHPLNPDLDELIKYASGRERSRSDDRFIRQRLRGVDRKHLVGAYRRAHVDLMRGAMSDGTPIDVEPSQTTRDLMADVLEDLWYDDVVEPQMSEFRAMVMRLDRDHLDEQLKLKGASKEEEQAAQLKLAKQWGHKSYKGFDKVLQPNRAKRFT